MNDLGQIAFRAILADGTQGIYRGDPVFSSVPEPSTLALMILGLAGIGYQRLRSKGASSA
ncbi:MAG: PEP-CTERM sorting domain-containing protein [Gammaproteobacteria bacterium]|nr:PEP-CTERM sorting domain-containing protein [Gammaproteobacteria bacterium]